LLAIWREAAANPVHVVGQMHRKRQVSLSLRARS
jgi:hypothetical protein